MKETLAELYATRSRIVRQLQEVDGELSGLKKSSPKRKPLLEKRALLFRQLAEQKERIANFLDHDPESVSDHALLRWLERRHGIDIDVLRRKMVTNELQAAIEASERVAHKKYHCDGHVVYVIDRGKVCTVLPLAASGAA